MPITPEYQHFVLIRSTFTSPVVQRILLGSRCIRCTAWKSCGRAFCESCFTALPQHLRRPLFQPYSLAYIEALHLALHWHIEHDIMKEGERSPTSDPDYDPGTVPEVLFPDLPRPSRH